jgi:hypothetical protein
MEEEQSGIAVCKTLFAKLTETTLKSCKTQKDAADLISAVCNWTSVILASLIVMIEGKNPQNHGKMIAAVDRITMSLNQEIKKHAILLRGMSNKAREFEENKIILPDSPKPN